MEWIPRASLRELTGIPPTVVDHDVLKHPDGQEGRRGGGQLQEDLPPELRLAEVGAEERPVDGPYEPSYAPYETP